jgi:DNA-directed RNA polymerase subunit beta'
MIKSLVEFRDASPATSAQTLLGITKAFSWLTGRLSAASFRKTTNVLLQQLFMVKLMICLDG